MKFTQEISEEGVSERLFELQVAGETVTGALWLPDGARTPRPLLLLAHGGSQHKLFPPLVAGARRYAREQRYAVMALDAPGHGPRGTPEQRAEFSERFRQRMASGAGLGGEPLAVMLRWATQAAPEWQAALDQVQALDGVGNGPVGYAGLSQGGMTGLLLAAREPRIRAAVIGLTGLLDGCAPLEDAARRLTLPLRVLVQWDDELIPRAAAVALFDRIASAEKTLHANPGPHAALPPFEREEWPPFFIRHLGLGGAG